MEGNRLEPSLPAIVSALPALATATSEFVVPKSIPAARLRLGVVISVLCPGSAMVKSAIFKFLDVILTGKNIEFYVCFNRALFLSIQQLIFSGSDLIMKPIQKL
jgi:hypothetical protein